MAYFVYLLKSQSTDRYYVGITDNLKRRLGEHNSGKNISTKRFGNHSLVWFKEYNSTIDARKHEKWLKKKNKTYKDRLAEVSSSPRLGQAG